VTRLFPVPDVQRYQSSLEAVRTEQVFADGPKLLFRGCRDGGLACGDVPLPRFVRAARREDEERSEIERGGGRRLDLHGLGTSFEPAFGPMAKRNTRYSVRE
jgi:hypothetical protein